MENEQILQKILEAYDQQIAGNRKAEAVIRKIGKKMATYADAQEMAVVCGQVLEDSLREYLPEALTDGMLYREAAEVVLKEPLLHSGEQVADVARQVQQELNEAAGIGLNAIEPALNMDQVDGIVTGVCNAQSYDSYKETLFDQATNFLQGTVDDTVRENAEFQYKAGLEPTIVRYAVGKCCEWCDGLAGTYPYERIRNKGNDVFRRHKNCRCVVEYNPGNGSKKRQNVHTRQWTEETDSDTIEQRRNMMPLDLQQFARTGKERAENYASSWQRASLSETVDRFAPGSMGTVTANSQKVEYKSADGHYSVLYDPSGDYFRILDNTNNTRKRYLALDGSSLANIMENGTMRGTHKDEYQRLTHFLNTDKERTV